MEENTRNSENQGTHGFLHAIFSFGLNPGQEHRFREYHLKHDKPGVMAGAGFIMIALMAFLYNDYLFLGISPLFFGFLGFRIYLLLLSVWFLYYSSKSSDYISYDRVEFIWVLNLAAFALLNGMSRPPAFISHVVQGTTVYYLPTDYPGYNTFVNALFVEGNTVYTAGYYFNNSINVPCYWTGGIRTDFGDGAHSAVVNSMFVQ